MQTAISKALLFPRNQVICLKNWKFWRAPINIEFNVFWWNFAHVFYLKMSTEGCSGLLIFCLDLELLIKMWKTWFLRVYRNHVIFNCFYSLHCVPFRCNRQLRIYFFCMFFFTYFLLFFNFIFFKFLLQDKEPL